MRTVVDVKTALFCVSESVIHYKVPMLRPLVLLGGRFESEDVSIVSRSGLRHATQNFDSPND
jgi:hypothetical protein